MRQIHLTIVLGLMIVAAGCSPWSTFPPIEGAVDIGDPGLEPFPTLMTNAIRYVYQQDGAQGELVYNLPVGTPWYVYKRVTRRLETARPLLGAAGPAYHVEAVRVRGTEAEVDVIHPGEGDVPQLVTLYMSQHLVEGWRVTRTRYWRIRVEWPEPTYTPPPDAGSEPGPDDVEPDE
jgi:hypothetical protein